jgi:Zn-dependent protease
VANFWVSIAGILANLLIALVAAIGLRIIWKFTDPSILLDPASLPRTIVTLLGRLFVMNVSLAIFNLLPIPPLDGSKILASILPGGFYGNLHSIEEIGQQYGFVILYAGMFLGLWGAVFGFFYPIAEGLLFLGLR